MKTKLDDLIAQLAADALVRDALLIALMEELPTLHARVEAKVAVVVHCARVRLAENQLDRFDERIADVLGLMRLAYPDHGGATG